MSFERRIKHLVIVLFLEIDIIHSIHHRKVKRNKTNPFNSFTSSCFEISSPLKERMI